MRSFSELALAVGADFGGLLDSADVQKEATSAPMLLAFRQALVSDAVGLLWSPDDLTSISIRVVAVNLGCPACSLLECGAGLVRSKVFSALSKWLASGL